VKTNTRADPVQKILGLRNERAIVENIAKVRAPVAAGNGINELADGDVAIKADYLNRRVRANGVFDVHCTPLEFNEGIGNMAKSR
jgi:hypothetical protein